MLLTHRMKSIMIFVSYFTLSSLTMVVFYLISQITRQPSITVFILWDLWIRMVSAVLGRVSMMTISSKRVVGIFSREGEVSYHFLFEALGFQDLLVRKVRTTTITNDGWPRFKEEVSRCDFAILYHSKTRGRLNITDVTDSIYDKELEHLSQKLGKAQALVFLYFGWIPGGEATHWLFKTPKGKYPTGTRASKGILLVK